MKDGKEKEKEAEKFWCSIEADSFNTVFSDEIRGYLERMVMDSYTDQVVIKKEEFLEMNSKKKV